MVGIDDRTIDDWRFAIFPNPANDVVKVEVQGSKFRVQRVEVADVLGRDCFSRSLRHAQGTTSFAMTDVLDVSDWPDGIYLLTLTDHDGNRHTQRLVVRH